MWTVTFFASTAVICGLSALSTLWLVARAAHERASLDRRVRSVESQLRSLTDSTSEQAEVLAALANRVKMMRVRTAVNHVQDPTGTASSKVDGLPDPHVDPEGWRTAMNKRLGASRIPRS